MLGNMPGTWKPHNPTNVTLAELKVFQEVPRDAVQALSRRCQWRWYGTNQVILQCCDHSQDVFFVMRGKARAIHDSLSGREVIFGEMLQGEMFGELAAIDGNPRSVGVVSAADSLIAVMPGPLFRETLSKYGPFAATVLRRLAGLVRSSSERIAEFSTFSVRNRVHAELLRLSRPNKNGNTAIISPAPTHAELASRISTHREAVTRELNSLARVGLIEKQRGRLVIHNLTALAGLLNAECGRSSPTHTHRLQ
jgi:CRP/FNR family transcriptional regulator, cyclic AMP receptor protein